MKPYSQVNLKTCTLRHSMGDVLWPHNSLLNLLCAGSEGSASRLPVLSSVHINTGTILLDVLCAR